MIYIHNTILYTPEKKIDQGALLVSGEAIAALGSEDELPCPTGVECIDAFGLTLVPGFIDLQINGAFGMDFSTDPETIWQVGERLVQFGVTSFLPTIVSAPPETIHHAQAVLQMGPPVGYRGARVLGLHLEGPYLNPEKSGAHNPEYITLPDRVVYEEWNPANHVRLVTLAPELAGSLPAIQALVQNGVVVGAGHSQADLSQAQAGFEAGICYGTHLFNAMPPLDYRKPGLVGALLEQPHTIAGIIVDGIHVSPTIIKLAWKILGISAITVGIYAIFLFFLSSPIARFFTEDIGVINAASAYNKFAAIVLIFSAAEVILSGAFSGAGDTLPPALIGLPMNLLRIPFSAILSPIFGLNGIWAAICLTVVLKGIIILIWFRRGKWKTKKSKLIAKSNILELTQVE